jgi:hypothetical protein
MVYNDVEFISKIKEYFLGFGQTILTDLTKANTKSKIDVECRSCKQVHTRSYSGLIKLYKNKGKLRCYLTFAPDFIPKIKEYFLGFGQTILTDLTKANTKSKIDVECRFCKQVHIKLYSSLINTYKNGGKPNCLNNITRREIRRKENKLIYNQDKLNEKGLDITPSNACKVYVCEETIELLGESINDLNDFELILDPYEVLKILNKRLYRFNKHSLSREKIVNMALFYSSRLKIDYRSSKNISITAPTIRLKFKEIKLDKVYIHPYLFREFLFLKFWKRDHQMVEFKESLKNERAKLENIRYDDPILSHNHKPNKELKKKEKDTRYCEYCKKEFKTNYKEQRYCSKSCRTNNKKIPKITKNCEYCKKEFKTNYKEQRYCSKSCRTANNKENPKITKNFESDFIEANRGTMTILEIETLLGKRVEFMGLSEPEQDLISKDKDLWTLNDLESILGKTLRI